MMKKGIHRVLILSNELAARLDRQTDEEKVTYEQLIWASLEALNMLQHGHEVHLSGEGAARCTLRLLTASAAMRSGRRLAYDEWCEALGLD